MVKALNNRKILIKLMVIEIIGWNWTVATNHHIRTTKYLRHVKMIKPFSRFYTATILAVL